MDLTTFPCALMHIFHMFFNPRAPISTFALYFIEGLGFLCYIYGSKIQFTAVY